MIKVIVLAVVGLLVGLGGTSGVAVMKAKKVAAAVQDSLAAHPDSSESKDEHGEKPSKAHDAAAPTIAQAPAATDHAPAGTPAVDSAAAAAHGAAPKTDSVATTASTDTHAAPAKAEPATTTKTLAHAPAPKPAAKAPLPKITPSTTSHDPAPGAVTPPAPGRLAKIFGAMTAKDAARVLEQMEDVDVQTVLSGMNDRQAAAILAGFPPARAAAISKAQLRKKGTS